jgi:hypothetical protein
MLITMFSIPLFAKNDSNQVRGIHVRDFDGQYLGVLVDAGEEEWSTESATIFIPSINKLIQIDIQKTGKIKEFSWIQFDDYGCFGNAYINGSIPRHNGIYRTGDGDTARYFNFDGFFRNSGVTLYSFLFSGVCHNYLTPQTLSYYREATEISVDEIPFSLPITLPVSYDTK